MKLNILIFVCFMAICSSAEVPTDNKLPPYIKICKRNSEALKCVLENIERCRPYLAKGIPRLLIPALDPLNLPELDIVGNNLRIKLKNLKVHNLPSLKVVDGKLEFEDFKLALKLNIPHIYNEFEYEAEGKILVLNFHGNGSGYTNGSDINLDIDAKAHPVSKEGRTTLAVDYVNVKYKATTGKFHVDNLFRDQKELNDQTNRLINENFREFEDEISPDIGKSISSVITRIATNILEKYSFDELFPLE